jgi:hypothetical protein
MPSSTSFTSSNSTKKHNTLITKKSVDSSSSSASHIEESKQPAVDQSFFVDIRVAPTPQIQKNIPAQQQQPQQQQPQQQPQQKQHHQQQIQPNSPKQAKPESLTFNSKEDKLEDKFDKVNINDFVPSQEKLDAIDLTTIVEQGHESFMKALKNRCKNTHMIRTMWINGSIKSALDTAANMNDTSLMADILGQINQSVNVWTLDICTILLPSIKELINSKYEEHAQIGSDSCKIVFKNFGKLIKSSLMSPVNVGVDLSREERNRKCNSCYGYLQDIILIIERKISMISSQKLLNNFKEINLLMKTLEN